MAGIDKTYLNYEQYLELVEWCKEKEYVEYPDGTKEPLSDYLCYHFSRDNFFDREGNPHLFPIWNTPTYFDCWLAKNCPLPYIQETLETQYSKETLEELKKDGGEYDKKYRNSFETRPGKKFTKFSLSVYQGRPIKRNFRFYNEYLKKRYNSHWEVEISKHVVITNPNGENFDYNEFWGYNAFTDHWSPYYSTVPTTTHSYDFKKYCSLKSVLRKIRKWNLPEGLKVKIMDFPSGSTYILKTK
ncbi:MAG: hypothetical protein ACI4TD_00320 [Phocaeicola sp.]